jgi:putative copper export protein
VTSVHTWLVFLHLLGATVWVGAWAAICLFAADAVRRPEEGALRRLYRVMRSLGPVVIGPSTLLVLAAGIALVVQSDRTAVTDLWIILGMVLYAAVTLVGVLGLGRASRTATAALDRGDLPAATAATRGWLAMAVVVTGLLLLATADMVFRP